MKKIIVVEGITSAMDERKGFLRRSDIRLLSAGSNAEALELHRTEKADLILVGLDAPGMSGEEFCAKVRADEDLCKVSIIAVGGGKSGDSQRAADCRANILVPGNLPQAELIEKMQTLLDISRRGAYRAPVSVLVEGKFEDRPFLCHSENISSSGMLFETDRGLSRGDRIVCSFILPDATRIKSGAEVVRVVGSQSEFDTSQYGVRFRDIYDEFRRAIERFVVKSGRGE